LASCIYLCICIETEYQARNNDKENLPSFDGIGLNKIHEIQAEERFNSCPLQAEEYITAEGYWRCTVDQMQCRHQSRHKKDGRLSGPGKKYDYALDSVVQQSRILI
jgi:hypothetical protein